MGTAIAVLMLTVTFIIAAIILTCATGNEVSVIIINFDHFKLAILTVKLSVDKNISGAITHSQVQGTCTKITFYDIL